MFKFQLLILIFSFTLSSTCWTKPVSCQFYLSPERETKLSLLQDASKEIAHELFRSEEILENPNRFKSFLKQLDATRFESVHTKEIDTLVDYYLQGILTKSHARSASIDVLTNHYSEQLAKALENRGIDVKKKKFRVTNAFKSVTFAAIWSVLAVKMQMYTPLYFPNFQKTTFTFEQKKLLIEKIPKLSHEDAIQFIQQEIPGVSALNVYQSIRRLYTKLMILTIGTTVLFSSPSLLYLDYYTPLGAPLKAVKAEVDLKWDQVFSDKAEMQNQVIAIQATIHGIDLSDTAAAQRLQQLVEKMTFAELHNFLN